MKKRFHIILLIFALLSVSCKNDNISPKPAKPENPPAQKPDFNVKFETSGQILQDVGNCVTMWFYWTKWHGAMEEPLPADYFKNTLPYVRYVQFVAAAGGSFERDLFRDPHNTAVKDDYDFTSLVRACRNVVRQGLIPYLKLGNVPVKFTKNYKLADFSVNICPPDDFRLWHNYIKALAKTLVAEFGVEQVRNWRFGSGMEFENKDWFSVDSDPVKSKEAFFKLYDYTVDALEEVLGKNICVGAHCMGVTEGLWDEREFIIHCARGTNYCTGKTGTCLSFMASSYYEEKPGKFGSGKTLPETISSLRQTAETYGLNNLFFGTDEGRILAGTDDKAILPRAVGYTWQAAYDARMYRMAYDHKINYISHWDYTSNGVAPGLLPVSAQTSALFHKMQGAIRLPVTYEGNDNPSKDETGAVAAWNQADSKLYLLFYAFASSMTARGERKILSRVSGLSKSGNLNAVRTLISDDSNFYDDWLADWGALGISKNSFDYWSPEGFVIDKSMFGNRYAHYENCSRLKPETLTLTATEGVLTVETVIPVHGVVLYEISIPK